MVLHRHGVGKGIASVWPPEALPRKYPAAHGELKWPDQFASERLLPDPRTGRLYRHHLHLETFRVGCGRRWGVRVWGSFDKIHYRRVGHGGDVGGIFWQDPLRWGDERGRFNRWAAGDKQVPRLKR